MKNDSNQATKAAPGPGLSEDPIQPIEQPGPIIIKSGAGLVATTGLVDVESPIFNFIDDGGRAARHYVSERRLRITSLLHRNGDDPPVTVNFTSPNVRVVINMEP